MTIPEDMEIPEKMFITFGNRRFVDKKDFMMLEMLVNCNWERPIYVAMTVGEGNYLSCLNRHFVQEGLVYRITPFERKVSWQESPFDAEKTYDAMMNRFKFGGLDKPGLYLDETVLRMCQNHRRIFAQLAEHLIAEGKRDKAMKVLSKMEKEIPEHNVPMNWISGGTSLVYVYGELGEKDKVRDVANKLWKDSEQYVNWYTSLDSRKFRNSQNECYKHLQMLSSTLHTTEAYDPEWAEQHEKVYQKLVEKFERAL